MTTHSGERAFAVVRGLALAGFTGAMFYVLVTAGHESGYDAVVKTLRRWILALGMLLTFVLTVHSTTRLRKEHATQGGILYLIWGPVVCVCAGAVVTSIVFARQDAYYESRHAFIVERHVNLSGRDLWLRPDAAGFPLNDPSRISLEIRQRTRQDHSDLMAEYAMERLAPGLKGINVYVGSGEGQTPVFVPARFAPGADEKAIAAAAASGGKLVYMYYHYQDRVEIIPTVELDDYGTETKVPANMPVANLHFVNLTTVPIVRVEINGHTVHLDAPIATTQECRAGHTGIRTLLTLGQSVALRWQSGEVMPPWKESTAAITRPVDLSGDEEEWGPDPLFVYFLADGSAAVQRTPRKVLANEECRLPAITHPASASP